MTSRRAAAAVAVVALAVLLAQPAAGAPAPDPEIQATLARVARAGDDAELAAALDDLRAAAPERPTLVPQLALYLLEARGEREGMAPAVVVSRLPIARRDVVRGVVPHLETADAALRAQLVNLLGAADQTAGGSADFADVRAVLEERGTPPSPALVAYMFERAPAEAAATLASLADAATPPQVEALEQARNGLRRDGELDLAAREEAAGSLDLLSRHPDWWLRAYAAQVARDEPGIADASESPLDRLTRDADARVQSVARGTSPH